MDQKLRSYFSPFAEQSTPADFRILKETLKFATPFSNFQFADIFKVAKLQS